MEYQEDLGFQIRTLSHLVKRMVDQTAFSGTDAHPTGVQGWILGYLYTNQDKEVFQRDIQQQFSIRRSTVTGILQLMEKNGLITRSSVDRDARLKKLELTPYAGVKKNWLFRKLLATLSTNSQFIHFFTIFL